jgi:CRP/FNR family cyclic AMP-dependent transcriptional regulator
MEDLSKLVGRHPFCEGLDAEYIELMAGCAKNVRFAAGEYLFRGGQDADRTFLLRAGRVGFQLEGSTLAETAEEGDLVGWSWLFDQPTWSFDAVAIGPVRAFEFDGACLWRKVQADPTFGFEIARRILFQATRRLERSRLQGLDLYGGPA